ncbi:MULTISPECIES: JAB domain-containing protein [unclassified Oleiphilus]|uniref:JAB domain-containing protein n=1 Tax=unclassified Oleiphilus TaxID=2631174 RepID=UPI0007C372ED|nr:MULTISPECIES: JAB domain-containing protein [unclassified Oleiphilus]KZY29762.1 hypothetical protein A3729_11795 [Oleiphilus sp. HI0043]KZZ66305.1 hypothetical protein A3763_17585 [Oleiphilus sp. HI0128]
MKQENIQIKDTHGNYVMVNSEDLISATINHIQTTFSHGLAITSSASAANHIQALIGHHEHEVFYAIWLNSQHNIIHHEQLFSGTVDGASVYPREVVKAGLACNAAAVIFAHNHPSGHTKPSQSDIDITKRLKESLDLVDIRVLDHMVVGSNVVSMAERGLM